ncbi:hypothetical protein [Pseudoalteromonas sp. H105]|jgi:hypothetical protein|uniref:hypothetical protein n=1 Tax=Pseudoalteromonas sp. H105 TaxID=1348393 RepID=UPI0007320D52|nr:hypothetical protein [Pseudoalteromonas sp. H105]KTF18380.1 hypothetical protein ATS75_02925 [Pseudoalteromonas sp. H105]
MNDYLKECKKLSLTARAAIALLVFKRYCEMHNLRGAELDKYFEHLWQWPLIDDPSLFDPWQSSRPYLVDFGLGDEASTELIDLLSSVGLSEERFRPIAETATLILWESFWGAAEDSVAMDHLERGLLASKLTEFPVLTPFKFSRFEQRDGWGDYITEQDRDFWRDCARYA